MPRATPALHRDQLVLDIHLPSTALNVHPSMQPPWTPPVADRHSYAAHGSQLKSSLAVPLSAGPVLPRLASLLNGLESRKSQPPDERKRTFLAPGRGDVEFGDFVQERTKAPCPSRLDLSLPAAPRVTSLSDHYAVYRSDGTSPQSPLDTHCRVFPKPTEPSSCYILQKQTQQYPLNSPPSFILGHDAAGRRRLLYHHSINSLAIRAPIEAPGVPHIHQHGLSKKHMRSGRFPHHHLSPPHPHVGFLGQNGSEKMNTSTQKRRRVVTPTSMPHQPLYESEYGLTVLETSKPLMGSRDIPSIEHATEGSVVPARRPFGRSNLSNMEQHNSPITVSSRLIFSGTEGGLGTSEPVTEIKTPVPAPCKQSNVNNREPFPLTTLGLSLKELLESNCLVRSCHDEVDWVATFLNIGFESSGIYALMCPLRKGRWKLEEESYTMGMLRLIENGTILLRHGQSIRGYIGEKLHSDDMRVLKKLSNCKLFHFAKLINPRLAQEEKVDMSVLGAQEGLARLEQLKGEFLRSVQLEALVAMRKHFDDSSLHDLVDIRA